MDIDDVREEASRAEFEPILRGELEELARSSESTAEDRAPVQLDQQSVGRLARMDAMQMQAMAAASERRRQSRGASPGARAVARRCSGWTTASSITACADASSSGSGGSASTRR